MYENIEKTEYAVLVGIDTGDYDAKASMHELKELAKTAGATVIAEVIQKKERPNTATYIGKGKLREICDFAFANDVDLLIFDCELSPSQQRNIEDFTEKAVIDRTALILDIFAARARSAEGKLQVELAQLNYRLPRLSGEGASLSRLGGGIGTRGPGESKLESDRRYIRKRINSLEEELRQVKKRRDLTRGRRKKTGIETAAIVGYTNAGKSTLMNALTDSGVLAEDKLFATLDPTARALKLNDGRKIMLVDTVGLIRRLPHNLIEAFKSTLEEAAEADVILNVCDASSNESAEHLKVTNNLLNELGCENKPILSVMNKCDLVPEMFDYPRIGNTVMISAKQKKGLDKLLTAIEKALPSAFSRVKLLLPFSEGALCAKIRTAGTVYSERFTPQGIEIDASVNNALIKKCTKYICYN